MFVFKTTTKDLSIEVIENTVITPSSLIKNKDIIKYIGMIQLLKQNNINFIVYSILRNKILLTI